MFVEPKFGVPRGIRTLVTGVKGRRPGPLDDGDARREPLKIPRPLRVLQPAESA